MRIRQAHPDDLHPILDLVRNAFETDAEACLVENIMADASVYAPEYSLVAVDDEGAVIGHVMLSWASVGGCASCCPGAAPCDIPLLALAPLTVAPAHQRTGVGTALAEAVIDRARTAGEDAILVLGDPEYYHRFGFRQAPDTVRPPAEVPPEAWMLLELKEGALSSADGVVRFADAFGDPALW